LSDQEKRAEYDQFGTINNNPNQDGYASRGGFHDNPFKTFEEFFANSNFHFGGGGGSSRKSPEETVNKR
jgi:DnaJ-class molecular chaperone